MAQRRDDILPSDLVGHSYAEIRAAFRRLLGLCTGKLKRSDYQLAAGLLGCDPDPDLGEDVLEMVMDTALYSRPGAPGLRGARRRAIDRIAPKLAIGRDTLAAALAAQLPKAIYSVFEVEGTGGDGVVAVRDMIDGRRPLRIMDESLAASVSRGTLLAMRLVDAGPWRIGFGVVHALRKSEAAAICLALAHDGGVDDKRDSLHELVYSCRIHDDDLALAAITPFVAVIAMAIDESDEDLASILDNVAFAPSK